LALVIASLKTRSDASLTFIGFGRLVLHASELSIDSEQPYCNVLVSEGWHSMLNIASIFPVKLLA